MSYAEFMEGISSITPNTENMSLKPEYRLGLYNYNGPLCEPLV